MRKVWKTASLKWRRLSMPDKQWCVYVHENNTNGKRYVGITSQKPANRWRDGNGYGPAYGYKARTPFFNAIQKYGWDGFDHIVLLSGVAQETAMEVEKALIQIFHTTDRSHGYNLTAGGEGISGIKLSPERVERMRQRMTGRYISGEMRRRMALAKKGCIPWNKGKHIPKTDAQMAAARKRGRKIQTVDGVFPSIAECARHYGIQRKTLETWLLGQRQPSKRYAYIHAVYLDDERMVD